MPSRRSSNAPSREIPPSPSFPEIPYADGTTCTNPQGEVIALRRSFRPGSQGDAFDTYARDLLGDLRKKAKRIRDDDPQHFHDRTVELLEKIQSFRGADRPDQALVFAVLLGRLLEKWDFKDRAERLLEAGHGTRKGQRNLTEKLNRDRAATRDRIILPLVANAMRRVRTTGGADLSNVKLAEEVQKDLRAHGHERDVRTLRRMIAELDAAPTNP